MFVVRPLAWTARHRVLTRQMSSAGAPEEGPELCKLDGLLGNSVDLPNYHSVQAPFAQAFFLATGEDMKNKQTKQKKPTKQTTFCYYLTGIYVTSLFG